MSFPTYLPDVDFEILMHMPIEDLVHLREANRYVRNLIDANHILQQKINDVRTQREKKKYLFTLNRDRQIVQLTAKEFQTLKELIKVAGVYASDQNYLGILDAVGIVPTEDAIVEKKDSKNILKKIFDVIYDYFGKKVTTTPNRSRLMNTVVLKQNGMQIFKKKYPYFLPYTTESKEWIEVFLDIFKHEEKQFSDIIFSLE